MSDITLRFAKMTGQTAGQRFFLSAAPLPPSRPFDLGTIPGANVPISGPRAARAAGMTTAQRSRAHSRSELAER